MSDIFAYTFMQNAFIAGILISIVLGLISFFVIIRQLSFIGVGISHSAFAGVAIGFLFGIDPTWSAVVFALIIANAIGSVARSGKLKTDTAIGIFFSFTMALGVILIGISKQYNVDLFGYLFGNILAITSGNLVLIALCGTVIIFSVAAFFKEIIFSSFDEELARASGLPVVFLDHLILSLLALSVVICIKVVGILLAEALLVIPAAAASQISKRYVTMIPVSIAVALVSSISGLLVSYKEDLPSGATIVTAAIVIFFVLMVAGRIRRKIGIRNKAI